MSTDCTRRERAESSSLVAGFTERLPVACLSVAPPSPLTVDRIRMTTVVGPAEQSVSTAATTIPAATLPLALTFVRAPVYRAAADGHSPPAAAVGLGALDRSPTPVYTCPLCGKYFISMKYIEMHMAVHASQQQQLQLNPSVQTPIINAVSPSALIPPPGIVLLDRSPSLRPQTSLPSAGGGASQTSPSAPARIVVPTAATVVATAPGAATPLRDREWRCDICLKTFSQNSSYKNHQRTHSDERPFVCTVCSIGFKERYHLKKHMLFKHCDEAREQCRVCGKRFKDSTAVRAHERIHSDARPYKCHRCQKAFKTSECLWHHENRSKSCGGGSRRDASGGQQAARRPGGGDAGGPRKRPRSNARHATTGDDKTNVLSAVAGIGMGLQPLTADQQRAPPAVASWTVGQMGCRSPAVVPVLSTISGASAVAQSRPPEVTSSSRQLSTAQCVQRHPPAQVESASIAAAAAHQRQGLVLLADCAVRRPETEAAARSSSSSSSPPTPPAPPPPATRGSCASTMLLNLPLSQVKVEPVVVLCDYELTAMTSLESSFYERIRMAAEPDTEVDDACSKTSQSTTSSSTDTTATLTDPDMNTSATNDGDGPEVERGTSGRRRPECEKCGRVFASIASYEKHAVVHSELRPYRCATCDVGFKLKVHLKKHNLYRHSDDYRCECRVCGKRFKDSSAVRLHERIHSADRPFACDGCGKTFKTRENLWGHRHRGPCGQLGVTAGRASVSQSSTSVTSAKHPHHRHQQHADERTEELSADDDVVIDDMLVAGHEVVVFGGPDDRIHLGGPVDDDDDVDQPKPYVEAFERHPASEFDLQTSASSSLLLPRPPPFSVASTSPPTGIDPAVARAAAIALGIDGTRAVLLSRMYSQPGRMPSSGVVFSSASSPSVPTAVVAPIKREMPDVLPIDAGNAGDDGGVQGHLPPFETFRAPTVGTGTMGAAPTGTTASTSTAVNLSAHHGLSGESWPDAGGSRRPAKGSPTLKDSPRASLPVCASGDVASSAWFRGVAQPADLRAATMAAISSTDGATGQMAVGDFAQSVSQLPAAVMTPRMEPAPADAKT